MVLNAVEFRKFCSFKFRKVVQRHVRFGGQCGMGFVANFFENTTAKKF